MSHESVMPSNRVILCCPLPLPPILPNFFGSFPMSRLFSESALCIRWPKYWSLHFSISPSNEYSELIFNSDLFDLLAVQRTLKSPLQHQNSKASILGCSAFFIVQLSHYSFLFWINIDHFLLREQTQERFSAHSRISVNVGFFSFLTFLK